MTGSLIIFWHSKKLDVNMSPFGFGLDLLFTLYKESCKAVKEAIIESKAKITQQKISDCNGDQKGIQNCPSIAWKK